VTVLSDPSEYEPFLGALEAGRLDAAWRRGAAARTFARVADYDRAIATRFLAATLEPHDSEPDLWPDTWSGTRVRVMIPLRYGENPHQAAAVYRDEPAWGLGRMRQIGGVDLSFNNLLGRRCGLGARRRSGWGAGLRSHQAQQSMRRRSWDERGGGVPRRLACDPVSAFGGIAAFNVPVDAELVAALGDLFPRSVDRARRRCRGAQRPDGEEAVARSRSPTGRACLRGRTPAARLAPGSRAGCRLAGARRDCRRDATHADRAQLVDLAFVWQVCKHVRSNAIVIGPRAAHARHRRGTNEPRGQLRRCAVRKARPPGSTCGSSVAASDASSRSPMASNAWRRRASKRIVHPGGSKR
jgi:phosphoribosylaminoimidazolecarboxamide formyltransferase/IMP cyclohydrolase